MNQMAKMNEAVGMKNRLLWWMGEGSGLFVLSKVKSSGNVLVAFYRKLTLGIKDTRFGVKYQNVLVVQHLLNYG